MNTDKLIEELERLRTNLTFKKLEDEDIIKVAIHRLKSYKKIINEHRC